MPNIVGSAEVARPADRWCCTLQYDPTFRDAAEACVRAEAGRHGIVLACIESSISQW